MSLGNEFPYVSTGNLYTCIDTYASTISTQPPSNSPSWPNGAYNPIGSAFLLAPGSYFVPAVNYPSASGSLNSKGWGAPMVVRYVRYNSTTNANLLATPGPVYWTDETYTTVTGTFSEGNPAGTGNGNSMAGLLLLNSSATSLNETGALAATALNGNFCFIVTKGFVPGVTVNGSAAIGATQVGTSGNFTFANVASGTAPTFTHYVNVVSAPASSIADVWVNCDLTF